MIQRPAANFIIKRLLISVGFQCSCDPRGELFERGTVGFGEEPEFILLVQFHCDPEHRQLFQKGVVVSICFFFRSWRCEVFFDATGGPGGAEHGMT